MFAQKKESSGRSSRSEDFDGHDDNGRGLLGYNLGEHPPFIEKYYARPHIRKGRYRRDCLPLNIFSLSSPDNLFLSLYPSNSLQPLWILKKAQRKTGSGPIGCCRSKQNSKEILDHSMFCETGQSLHPSRFSTPTPPIKTSSCLLWESVYGQKRTRASVSALSEIHLSSFAAHMVLLTPR